jgi:hypothetical protein
MIGLEFKVEVGVGVITKTDNKVMNGYMQSNY